MFQELSGQTWTGSDGTVAIENNTDISIDGSSKKITWTATSDAYVTIACDEIDLSVWEEVSMHIYLAGQLTDDDLFKITIDGEEFTFNRTDFRFSQWNHVIFDCSEMGPITSFTITALLSDLILFVDYIGVRKVTYNCDVDIIEALKEQITLDYDVATTLSADADAGDENISLASKAYISGTSVLEIDDGAGIEEAVELINMNCDLNAALTNSFSAGDEVRVICPIRSEDYNEVEPDPICGIKVFDVTAERREDIEMLKNGIKIKEYLGTIGIAIYIDCSFKKKLLQLVREYNRKYGNEFRFLLDGERVDIYMDNSVFADSVIGNNPRMTYYYRIEPSPYLFAKCMPRTTDTITADSVGANE